MLEMVETFRWSGDVEDQDRLRVEESPLHMQVVDKSRDAEMSLSMVQKRTMYGVHELEGTRLPYFR